MFQSTVQIAGIRSLEEARLLESLDVDFIGIPLRLGYHKPDISESEAREIISQLKAPQSAVLITYLDAASEIQRFMTGLGVQIVQLHGDISIEEIRKLRESAPDIQIIKSLIIRPDDSCTATGLLELAQAYQPFVDAFITDTFDPSTGASGATGLTHNWEISAFLSRNLTKPLILAGGLNPSNVHDAIVQVRPAAVDSHTGVEDSQGAKDGAAIREFVKQSRLGFDEIATSA